MQQNLAVVSLHFAGAFVSTWLCLYVLFAYRWQRSTATLLWPLVSAAVWSVGYVGDLMSTSIPVRVVWAVLTWLGSACLCPAIYSMAYCFVHGGKSLPQPTRWAMALTSTLSFSGFLTNPQYGLLFAAHGVAPGPWFVVQIALQYPWLLVGLGLCMHAFRRGNATRRLQASLLIAGMLLPFLSSGLVYLGLASEYVTTPLLLNGTLVLFLLGIHFGDLFNLVPAGLDLLLGRIGAGLLTVDRAGMIRKANPAAATFLTGRPDRLDLKGKQVAKLIHEIAPYLTTADSFTLEVHVEATAARTSRILRLTGSFAHNLFAHGWMILLEDITSYRRTLQEVKWEASQLQRHNQSLSLLQAATGELASTSGLVSALDSVLARLIAELHLDTVRIYALHPRSRRLRLLTERTATRYGFPLPRPRLHDLLWYGLLQDGYVIDSVRGERLASHLLAVVHNPQAEMHYLVQVAAQDRLLDPEDASLVTAIGTEVLATKRRLSKYSETRRLADRDFLTGLYNHRYMQGVVERHIRPEQGGPIPLVLAVIDIDKFKLFNDTYGHKFGDRVIQRVGRVVRRHLPKGAIAARYGGDEFVLAFPRFRDEDVAAMVQNMVDVFANAHMTPEGAEPVPIYISVGLSHFPRDAHDLRSLIETADRAMYRAKAEGGQRFYWASQKLSV